MLYPVNTETKDIRHTHTFFIIDKDIGKNTFIILKRDDCMCPETNGQAVPVKMHTANCCRQVEVFARLGFIGYDLSSFQGMKTRIQDSRMKMITFNILGNLVRHSDLCNRLIRSAPDVGYLAEIRAKLIPCIPVFFIILLVICMFIHPFTDGLNTLSKRRDTGFNLAQKSLGIQFPVFTLISG